MHEVKFRNLSNNYSVIIGNNSLNVIQKKIKKLCPKTKKIALILDSKVPSTYINIIKKKLTSFETFFFKDSHRTLMHTSCSPGTDRRPTEPTRKNIE